MDASAELRILANAVLEAAGEEGWRRQLQPLLPGPEHLGFTGIYKAEAP